MAISIDDAGTEMVIAADAATRRTRRNLVLGEDGVRLVCTRRPIVLAHQAARTIGPTEVLGAVDLTVDRTPRLMTFADHSLAARTIGDLVRADNLPGATLALERASLGGEIVTSRAGLCPIVRSAQE